MATATGKQQKPAPDTGNAGKQKPSSHDDAASSQAVKGTDPTKIAAVSQSQLASLPESFLDEIRKTIKEEVVQAIVAQGKTEPVTTEEEPQPATTPVISAVSSNLPSPTEKAPPADLPAEPAATPSDVSSASASSSRPGVRFSDRPRSFAKRPATTRAVSGKTYVEGIPEDALLFDTNGRPTPKCETLLQRLARHMIDEMSPVNSLVIGPSKIHLLYDKFQLDKEVFPFTRVFTCNNRDACVSIGDLYEDLECDHHLVPPEKGALVPPPTIMCRPRVPALTVQGFVRYYATCISAYPDEESKRLQRIVGEIPSLLASDGDEKDDGLALPKQLTRGFFPVKHNTEARKLLNQAMEEFLRATEKPSRTSSTSSLPPPPPGPPIVRRIVVGANGQVQSDQTDGRRGSLQAPDERAAGDYFDRRHSYQSTAALPSPSGPTNSQPPASRGQQPNGGHSSAPTLSRSKSTSHRYPEPVSPISPATSTYRTERSTEKFQQPPLPPPPVASLPTTKITTNGTTAAVAASQQQQQKNPPPPPPPAARAPLQDQDNNKRPGILSPTASSTTSSSSAYIPVSAPSSSSSSVSSSSSTVVVPRPQQQQSHQPPPPPPSKTSSSSSSAPTSRRSSAIRDDRGPTWEEVLKSQKGTTTTTAAQAAPSAAAVAAPLPSALKKSTTAPLSSSSSSHHRDRDHHHDDSKGGYRRGERDSHSSHHGSGSHRDRDRDRDRDREYRHGSGGGKERDRERERELREKEREREAAAAERKRRHRRSEGFFY